MEGKRRISELTEERVAHRPMSDEEGRVLRDENRRIIYEESHYTDKYDPSVDDFRIRTLAKIIDGFTYVVFGFFLLLFLGIEGRLVQIYVDLMSIGIVLFLILNPLWETLYGQTFGKFLCRIQVINDYARYPNLLLSYKRNFLSLASVFVMLRGVPGGMHGFDPNRHNLICGTYTIPTRRKKEILEKLEEEG